MGTKLPSGVKYATKVLADGTEKKFFYHRATRTRLPDDPASYEFHQRVERLNREVEEQKTKIKTPTIAGLIQTYCQSPEWLGLAASTREIERFNLNAIENMWGDMELTTVEQRGARKLFLEWRDMLAEDHPRAADAKLARLARVFSFGLDREDLLINPLAKFKRIYTSNRSEKIWLPHHIEAFSAVADGPMQLALALGLYTGQRQGDIRALTWDQYDGAAIRLVQGKTGARVYVPCTTILKEILDANPRTATTILATRRHHPWARSNFASTWDRTYERAGLTDDLHFHDLRGTAVTMLAEAGCSVPEIAAITGHTLDSVDKILEKYLSRTRTMAHNAIAKWENLLKGGD